MTGKIFLGAVISPFFFFFFPSKIIWMPGFLPAALSLTSLDLATQQEMLAAIYKNLKKRKRKKNENPVCVSQ